MNTPTPIRTSKALTTALLAAIFTLAGTQLWAGTDTWTGNADAGNTSTNWSTAGNWTPGAPMQSDSLVFSGANNIFASNDMTGLVIGSIGFSNILGAQTTLNGNSLTLTNGQDIGAGAVTGGGITNVSDSTQTILFPMTLSAGAHPIFNSSNSATTAKLSLNGTITRNTGAVVVFSNNAAGVGGGINLTASGLLTNVSPYSNILGGWAVVSSNDWAALDINSNVVAFAGYTNVVSGAAILTSTTFSNNVKITSAGQVSQLPAGGGGVTVDINTLAFAAAASNSIPSGAILRLGRQGGVLRAANFGGACNVGINTNGFLTAGGPTAGTAGEITFWDSPFDATGSDNINVAACITNNVGGAVSVNTVGYVLFRGTNQYTGGTYILKGRLTASQTNSFGAGPVYVYPGGQAFPNAGSTSGGNGYTNDFYISGAGTLEGGGFGAIRMGGRTLSGKITLLGNAQVGGAGGTHTGKITGPGGLIVGGGTGNSGSGTLTIGSAAAANDYQGDTTINNTNSTASNILKVAQSNIMPHGGGAGNLILNGQGVNPYAEFDLNGKNEIINALVSSSISPANNFVTNSTGASTLTVGDNNASGTFAGSIFNSSGTIALVKIGSGTETLSGFNPYVGNTTISNGVLALSGSATIPGTPRITVVSPGVFDVSTLSSTFTLGASQILGGNGIVTGAVALATGARLDPGLSPGTLSFSNNLTMNGTTTSTTGLGGVTNFFDLSNDPNGANDQIIVQGNLTLTGTNTIVINAYNGGLSSGTYKLILYKGSLAGNVTGGTNNLVFTGISAAGTRQTFTLDDSIPGEIDLVVGGAAANLTWVGDGTVNAWDTLTTKNWTNSAITDFDFFYSGDFVKFDDTGSQSPAVNLTGANTPGSTVVGATANYAFGGNGSISAGILTKTNSGSLIISNTAANTFSSVTVGSATIAGGTLTLATPVVNALGVVTVNSGTLIVDCTNTVSSRTVAGGTLQIGNGDAKGGLDAAGNALGSGTLTDSGTVVFNRTDNITVDNVVNGTGTVQQNGSGVVTLRGSSGFGGGLTANSGTVRIGTTSGTSSTAAGTGTITINTGATVVYQGTNIPNNIIMSGGTLGEVFNNNQGIPGQLTATANTTNILLMGDPANLAPSQTDGSELNFTNTWHGSGSVIVATVTNDTSADSGSGFRLRSTAASDFSGIITLSNNVKGEIQTVVSNATFSPAGTGKFRLVCGIANRDNTQNEPVFGGYPEFNMRNNSAGNTVFGNDVELVGSGLAVFDPLGSATTNTTIGMGNLKLGDGQEAGIYVSSSTSNHVLIFTTVTLTGGIATFSPKIPNFGGTSTGGDFLFGAISGLTPDAGFVMNGLRILYLTGANTYTGPTTVSNGLLQVNGSIGPAPVTVAAGTLGGIGTISGPITVMSGGTLAPGASPGTLTVTTNLTLQAGSTSYFLLNKSVPTYSKIVGISNLTYNGTLVVSNLAGVLVTNDTFKLYDALAYSGSFTSSNLPTPTGLAWDTSGLSVNGSIKLVCNGTLTANAGPPKTICSGAAVGIGGSPTASGGSLTGYTYGWSPAAGLSATNVANPTASPVTTTTYAVTVTDTNGCTASSSVLVTVNPTPAITLGANPAVCSGATSANLTYSATTGSPDTYSIIFDSAAHTAGFADVNLAALPASPIVITVPGAAPAATYNGTLSVSNSATGCFSAGSAITVTVSPSPTITLGANPAVCAGTISANLSYSATTGSPDKYSIVFDSAAHTAGFADVNLAALPASPIVITVPGAAPAATYNGTLSVSNSATGCSSTGSAVTVTVNPGASISSGPTPSSQAVCSGSSAGFSVTASGGSLNYAWRKRGTGWGTGHDWNFSNSGGSLFFGSSTDNDSGDTASNGGNDINSGNGKAWAIYNNGGSSDAIRTFSSPLAVGQIVSIDMDNGNIQNGGKVGLSLRNSSGENRLEFYFAGGDTDYTVKDSSPHDSGISFTRTGVNVLVRLTGTDSYSITVKRYSDNATVTLNGTLSGTAGTSIDRINLSNASAGDCGFGCNNNTLYFNNLVAGANDDNAGNYTAWNNGDNFGDGPLSNGSPISGADTATLTINPATAGNAGSYDVVVWNTCGQVTSSAASLTVNALPTVYTVGGGGAYCSGGSGVPVTLSGSDIGVAYLLQTNGVYNGVTLPGTGSALSFNNQTAAATYTVLASNTTSTCTSSMSGNATVTINPLPVADAGAPQLIAPGDSVGIGGSPTASGGSGGGYSYSWSPATGLSATNVANPTASPIVSTTYSVTVTDGNGCVSASSTVLVTVVVNTNPPVIVTYVTNGNKLVLSWRVDHTGWRLQGQTNDLNSGLSNNWAVVNGSAGTNRVYFILDQTKGTVFFRMIYP